MARTSVLLRRASTPGARRYIKPWFADHVEIDAHRVRRWAGQDIDLSGRLPSDLIMAGCECRSRDRALYRPVREHVDFAQQPGRRAIPRQGRLRHRMAPTSPAGTDPGSARRAREGKRCKPPPRTRLRVGSCAAHRVTRPSERAGWLFWADQGGGLHPGFLPVLICGFIRGRFRGVPRCGLPSARLRRDQTRPNRSGPPAAELESA